MQLYHAYKMLKKMINAVKTEYIVSSNETDLFTHLL